MISATASMSASTGSEAGHQVVERVGQRGPYGRGQVRVDLRRAHAPMAEDLLNDPETYPGFMQMGPVRMSERVHAGTFGHPTLPPRTTKRTLQTAVRDRPTLVREAVLEPATRGSREEPLARPMGAPVVAQPREERRRQRHVAVAAALAVNVQQHPATVDVGDLDPRAFEQPQAARVDRRQALAVDADAHQSEYLPHLVAAEHGGQPRRRRGPHEAERRPGWCSVCSYRNRIAHNAIVAVVRATCFSFTKYRKYWRNCSSVSCAGLAWKCSAGWRTAAT